MASVLLGLIGERREESVRATIGGRPFLLEVAKGGNAMDRGLGGRGLVGPGRGMLFVFSSSETRVFTMRDCMTPLDLLYLDDQARVIDVMTMEPESARSPAEMVDDAAYVARLRGYLSSEPSRYAVEIAGGAAEALGVRPGDAIAIEGWAIETRAGQRE